MKAPFSFLKLVIVPFFFFFRHLDRTFNFINLFTESGFGFVDVSIFYILNFLLFISFFLDLMFCFGGVGCFYFVCLFFAFLT